MKYFIVIILILLASLLDRKLLESFTNCKKKENKLNTNTLRIPPVASNWNSKIIRNEPTKLSYEPCNKGCIEGFISSPFIWVYYQPETSSKFWKTFYSRRNQHPMPNYLQLCLKSIRKHNSDMSNIQVIGNHNLKAFIRGCPKLLKSSFVSEQIKKDFIKYQILYTYGGIWLEADTIVFKNFSPIFNKINENKLVTFDCDRDNITCDISKSDNYQLAANPKNNLIKLLLSKTISDAKIINNDYSFSNRSKQNLMSIVNKFPNLCHNFGSDFCASRDYNGKLITAENLLSNNFTIIRNSDKALFMKLDSDKLSEHPKYSWIERLSKKQLLESNLWMAKLLRKSLDLPDAYFDEIVIQPSSVSKVEINTNPTTHELVESLKNSNLYLHNPYALVNKESHRNS